MIRFIDDHRNDYEVESICQLLPEIQRVWDENEQVYGSRKILLQLNREEIPVASCTVERLMKQLGIQGVSRVTASTYTMISDADQDKPQDKVNRLFTAEAPNQLWVADITYVPT